MSRHRWPWRSQIWTVTTIWPQHEFSLSLDQSLIVAMEDEARWMIGSNLTPENDVPNLVDYIDVDALKKVAANAARIIR